jgi:photosystem II P680 reaction center D1 protein
MRPWIFIGFPAAVMAALAVFIIYPIGQVSFSNAMPFGISRTFNFILVFQAEYKSLCIYLSVQYLDPHYLVQCMDH